MSQKKMSKEEILTELKKVEENVAGIEGNEMLKKEIERIKELINYIPGAISNSETTNEKD